MFLFNHREGGTWKLNLKLQIGRVKGYKKKKVAVSESTKDFKTSDMFYFHDSSYSFWNIFILHIE